MNLRGSGRLPLITSSAPANFAVMDHRLRGTAVRRRLVALVPRERGQRGDKISRRRADSLVQVASAHFKATRRRLPVGAVLFYRNAHHFREQRLDGPDRRPGILAPRLRIQVSGRILWIDQIRLQKG